MKVDVIIPIYKPDDTLCLLLQKLQEQTFAVHKVILINTEEAYWKAALERYPIQQILDTADYSYLVEHTTTAEFDHGGTRQHGAELSDADVMIFMTQDAVPADCYLVDQLVAAVTGADEAGEVAVAYARQLPNADCHIVEQYTRSFNYPDVSRRKGKADIPELGIKAFFCSDVCAAYRKDIFETLGGFYSPMIFSEDMVYAAKAIEHDYCVVYAAEAKVFHSHNYTARQQFHRNFDLAVSQKMHPEVFERVSSESEGIRLVLNTIKYLCKIKKPWLVFELGTQCVGKYTGYLLGKRYEKLSRKQILKYTTSPAFWERYWKQEQNLLKK